MAESPIDKNRDDDVALDKKLDDLYELIDGIEVAMFTTRRADGRLVSRPMQTVRRAAGADLWFVTDIETHKLTELIADMHVNVSYYRDRTREWVSVSGTAAVSDDRETVRKLYSPTWRAWFPDQGGERNGGPDDPRIALILVTADSVTYMKADRPAPAVLFEVAKAVVTRSAPRVGEQRELNEQELRIAQHRDIAEPEARA